MTDEATTTAEPLERERENLAELTKALAAAQGEFPTIEKKAQANIPGRDGRQGYSYNYADIGDVLAAVRPVLSKHGLALVQRTRHTPGKPMLLTELHHGGSGQVLESEVELGANSSNAQQFGASLTYLRRYEVVTLLGIAAEEDRDAQDVDLPARGNGGSNGQPQAAWAKPATRGRIGELGVALAPLMGRARAAAIVSSVKASIDMVPDGFVGIAKAIAQHQQAALEATGTLEAHQRELQIQAEQAAKDAAEAEQAAAAQEQSGEPEPEPSESAEDPPAGYGEEPPDGVLDDGTPAAGTVEVSLAGIDNQADAEERLRENGCICTNPTAPDDDKTAHDDNCPIKGHGIPF